MTVAVVRADARDLPLEDASVDLVVTSPPYFGLRSYTDGGEHYAGQIGSEPTPQQWLANLWACTAEWVRVLKPEGSLFVNLGDKYVADNRGSGTDVKRGQAKHAPAGPLGYLGRDMARHKSLLGLPWRYALGCTDQLGLILRAEIIWAKPNGLPESVTDRVRRAHEQVFHFTRQPRYYSAVDEIREGYSDRVTDRQRYARRDIPPSKGYAPRNRNDTDRARGILGFGADGANPLGKLPGSVWDIPSQPLTVPGWLGVDHFACVDAETEILTSMGWLRHWELNPGTVQVAGYDLDTNTARWTDCTAVNRYDYDGDLIAVESRDLSMRLTPNHRTIVQRMHTRSHKRSPVSVIRADQLDGRHFIPRSASFDGQYPAWRTTEPLTALMGWVAAEGWYSGKRVRLSQSLEVNPENVAVIDQLIPDAARSERRRSYRGQPWTEVVWTLDPIDQRAVLNRMPDKLLPWWLVIAREDERRSCLTAFIAGDGHRRPDGRISIFQKHRHNLDVLQAIAVTLGYKTTLRESGGRFVLYLTEGGRSVTLRGTSGVGSKVRREHYKGVVWCPTTGTGTFIARRNGSVFVTGNSFPMELPRRIIAGWSPPGVCIACNQGRRPVAMATIAERRGTDQRVIPCSLDGAHGHDGRSGPHVVRSTAITGYACACPQPDAPTRPAVVLDPFGGTGTTALIADVLGRHGISVDLSADYCRLATWRTSDPGERARAMQVPKPPPVPDGQEALFDMERTR